MQRQQQSSGTHWEERAGYSRVVRVGPFVYVSGTTAINAVGQIQHPGDLYGQTKFVLEKIETALSGIGAARHHIVRVRVYVTDMAQSDQAIRAHKEFFDAVRPANTLVEVSQLAVPEMLVEVEVDAVISEEAVEAQ
ncbi:MAG: RidA family protein [Cyanobacteria bacterium P01_A01_bin.135]